jgi:DNA-binding CsgD family transcriptional regulator
LLVYRFVNFLRRSQRGGMTHIPEKDTVRLVSESVTLDETDAPVSLLDSQAIADHQDNQVWEEQQVLRQSVRQEFEAYLEDNLGVEAAQWLRLYLQGQSQETIANRLNLPIKQVYRMREKISYHAIRVFSIKGRPELVASWLETSLQEHSLGLTPRQWQEYWQSLSPQQRHLLEQLRDGRPLESIAKDLNLKSNQVMGEWSKLYLAAQALRSAS